ncbi:MAG: hypothetical protein HY675_17445 [Chloroflexi bacterium]|nr:hypothetical protein [Chloroflexota bacterium]
MFARLINFKLKQGTVDEMRKLTEQVAVPWLRGQKGFHGLHLVQVSDTEMIAFETFERKEDVDAIREETERKIQQVIGHILAAPPSFTTGNLAVHAAGHEPHRGPGLHR